MTELEMTADDAETEDFTDELSDEALDRESEGFRLSGNCAGGICARP